MEIRTIKELIESKLACIDIQNKQEGEATISLSTRLAYELVGIKQVLDLMGFCLEIRRNPYCYENGEPSTYTLTLN